MRNKKDHESERLSDLRRFLFPEKSLIDQKSKYQTKAEKLREKKKKRNREYQQKHKEKIKEKGRAYYQENKEKLIEKRKIYRQNNKEEITEKLKVYHQKIKEETKWVVDIKRAKGCSICGENDSDCLDFDHIDPQSKEYGICYMVQKKRFSREMIEAEIAKCQILCANCHRKKMANERRNRVEKLVDNSI